MDSFYDDFSDDFGDDGDDFMDEIQLRILSMMNSGRRILSMIMAELRRSPAMTYNMMNLQQKML